MLMMIGLLCWRRWLLSESRVGWKFAKYSLRKGSAKIVWQRPEWKANRQLRQTDNSNNTNKGTATTTTGIVLQLLLLLPLLLLMLRFENRTGQFYFYHGMQFIYKMVRGSFPLPLWVLKKNNSNNNNNSNDWQIIMNNYHRQTTTIIKITATATRQTKQSTKRTNATGTPWGFRRNHCESHSDFYSPNICKSTPSFCCCCCCRCCCS